MKDLGDFGRYQFLKRTSKAPEKWWVGRLRRSFPFGKWPIFQGLCLGVGPVGLTDDLDDIYSTLGFGPTPNF